MTAERWRQGLVCCIVCSQQWHAVHLEGATTLECPAPNCKAKAGRAVKEVRDEDGVVFLVAEDGDE